MFKRHKRVDKKTQLLLFFNNVYLGTADGKAINGFDDAAEFYFGNEFSELTEEEYIALTAMIIGPNEFNIKNNPMNNQERVRRIKRLLNGECNPRDNSDVYYDQCIEFNKEKDA